MTWYAKRTLVCRRCSQINPPVNGIVCQICGAEVLAATDEAEAVLMLGRHYVGHAASRHHIRRAIDSKIAGLEARKEQSTSKYQIEDLAQMIDLLLDLRSELLGVAQKKTNQEPP